jgi:hypothetical protein
VAVGELAGAFRVLAPAAFEVSEISVEPTGCLPGKTVAVTMTVKNTGETEGVYTPLIEIDGEREEQPAVTLTPAATARVRFLFNKNEPGVYTVSAGGLTAAFSVFLACWKAKDVDGMGRGIEALD